LPGVSAAINSGAGAILLAQYLGASNVILLGYDCQRTNGESHWHGDHQQPLSQSLRFYVWRQQFAAIAKKHSNIINCSRETALTCFPRRSLADGLCYT
jgi:hypothetical protein